MLRITCDEGYQHKDQDVTAECKDGTWSSVPVCESKSVRCVTQVSCEKLITVTTIISVSKAKTHVIHLDTFLSSCS